MSGDNDGLVHQELDAEHRRIDQQIRDLWARQRELSTQIDELRLAERPPFPTQAQCDGIAEALRMIREDASTASHHGDPTLGTYDVVVDTKQQWISVAHRAPYKHGGGAGKLWSFTDDEVQALLELIRASGFGIFEHWLHDRGLSILVAEEAP